MKRITTFMVSTLLFYSCDFGGRKVMYRGDDYRIKKTELGISFVDKFDGVEYYISKTVYESNPNQFYCKIAGSQDKPVRWVLISDGKVKDIDSTQIQFKSCKKLNKVALIR